MQKKHNSREVCSAQSGSLKESTGQEPRWDAICPALSASLNGCHCKSWNCFMTIRWTLDLTSAVYDFQLLWKLWAVHTLECFPTERAQRSTTEENTKIWNDCFIWSTAIAMWLLGVLSSYVMWLLRCSRRF